MDGLVGKLLLAAGRGRYHAQVRVLQKRETEFRIAAFAKLCLLRIRNCLIREFKAYILECHNGRFGKPLPIFRILLALSIPRLFLLLDIQQAMYHRQRPAPLAAVVFLFQQFVGNSAR